MKGWSAQFCAVLVVALVIGSLAEKSRKTKKVPSQNAKGPFGPTPVIGGPFGPVPNVRGPFGPPLPLPPVAPFQLAPIKQGPELDAYACLPKYLCIVENKRGEKRTTIVHGLHPALRKPQPNVIDPADLPSVAGKPFPTSQSSSEGNDDLFRDREFDDSFLKQQEMAEALAFLEEKRRQFLYHQGLPTQKIFPKGKKKGVQPVADKGSQESVEDEEEEKSKEEKSKEEEASKEDKEDKSAEKSVEKSVEASKEEQKEAEQEESAEEDESQKSRSKLSKYTIKRKKQQTSFKSRMDYDYEDSDVRDDHVATVSWDDRVKNESGKVNPREIYDKLVGSIPKLARRIPGISMLTSSFDEPTTTTTQKPGILTRILMQATGLGKGQESRPQRRYKRDTESDEEEEEEENDEAKIIPSNDKIVKQIRDPEKQCRMIFPGCDLPYEHIMKMVSSGQVLIENDRQPSTTTKKPVVDPSQDDELEQALKDKNAPKKVPSKFIPQILPQPMLGGHKKDAYKFKPGGMKKKQVASLPLMPMTYQWGKPKFGYGENNNDAPVFSGGIRDPNNVKKPAPSTTTTTTTRRPVFAPVKLDPKNNHSAPIQHSVIQVNKTHAVHVLSKKPYNPAKTRTRDAKGNPLSFNSVFTEIAGTSGGINDFFDKISGAFGGAGLESGREFPGAFPGGDNKAEASRIPASPHAKPTAFPQSPIPPDHIIKDDNDDDEPTSAQRDDDEDSEEEGDEAEDEEDKEEEDENEDNDEEEDDIADEVLVDRPIPRDPPGPVPIPGLQAVESQKQKPKVRPQQPEPESEEAEVELVSAGDKKKVRPDKKKKPAIEAPEEEEEEEEEEENDDEGEMQIPDNVPPFIRQSMIEDMKRKKQEKEQGGQQQGQGRPGQQQGHGRPGQQQGHGRPGQQGGGQGGYGPQSQGGPSFGSQSYGPGGGLFSSLFG